MAKEHKNYLDIIEGIKRGNWGADFTSDDEAEKTLACDPDRLAAWGILKLVRRFDDVFSNRTSVDDDDDNLIVPDSPLEPGDIKQGQKLYQVGYDSIRTNLVVLVDEFVWIIACDRYLYDAEDVSRPSVVIAENDDDDPWFTTFAEAKAELLLALESRLSESRERIERLRLKVEDGQ